MARVFTVRLSGIEHGGCFSVMADVYDALKPTLYVCKCFGLAPFSFDSEARRLNVSKLGLAFSALVLILYGGTSGWVVYNLMFNKLDKKDRNNITEVNEACQVACEVGVTIITILLTIIQRNKMLTVVNSVHQINEEMQKLKISVPYETMGKISLIQVICLLVYLVFLSLHKVFVWFDGDETPAVWIASLIPATYNYLMEIQFITGALLLKKHFTLLNSYLMAFTSKATEGFESLKENEAFVDAIDTFIGPKLIDSSFIAWDGTFSRLKSRKEPSVPEKHTQLSNIKIFRKVHSSLCDVKEALNSAFSLQLLASVAQAFVIITADLYLLFTTLSDDMSTASFQKIAWLTHPVVWTITHILELIFVVVTCTKTSKQANQTAVVVHKLLARDCNPDLRNQLKLFSIQLLHRKISFSACGFFTLDMTLLQAIIGAATTYLVILIQFHLGNKTQASQ